MSVPPRVPKRQPLDLLVLLHRGRDAVGLRGRHRRRAADRGAADLARRGQVALHQRLGHLQHAGDVVEAVARAVGGQQRRRRRCRAPAYRGWRCGTRRGSGDGTFRCGRDSASRAAAASSAVSSYATNASWAASSGRGRAGRRHQSAAQLADDLLPDLGVVADVRDVEARRAPACRSSAACCGTTRSSDRGARAAAMRRPAALAARPPTDPPRERPRPPPRTPTRLLRGRQHDPSRRNSSRKPGSGARDSGLEVIEISRNFDVHAGFGGMGSAGSGQITRGDVVEGDADPPPVRSRPDHQHAEDRDERQPDGEVPADEAEVDDGDDRGDRQAVADHREGPRVAGIALEDQAAVRAALEVTPSSREQRADAAVRTPLPPAALSRQEQCRSSFAAFSSSSLALFRRSVRTFERRTCSDHSGSPNAFRRTGSSSCIFPRIGRFGVRPSTKPLARSRSRSSGRLAMMCTGTSQGARSPETAAGRLMIADQDHDEIAIGAQLQVTGHACAASSRRP